jgi:uncharacterized protein (TIGR02594 family)
MTSADANLDETIDRSELAEFCLDAARDYGTSAHYLVALAHLESGIRNVAAPAGSAFGPFQITQAAWEDYAFEPDVSLTDDDRFDPMSQPRVAAKIAATAMERLQRVLPEGRWPSHAELYCAHFFGVRGAEIVLGAGRDRGRSVREALLEVYRAAADPAARVEAVIAGNPGILQSGGRTATVAEALEAIERKLEPGLELAADLINQLEPDLFAVPVVPAREASAPWMEIAKAEIGVQEIAGAASNPRIDRYFRETGLAKPNDETAWCAIFLSWCIKTATGKALPYSALARDWLRIGTRLPGPAYGAIAVTHPLAAGSSGHVAFVVKEDASRVFLLGGNQTPPGGGPGAVCITTFKKTAIREYRSV